MNAGEVFKLVSLLIGLVVLFRIYRWYKSNKDLPKSGLAKAGRFSALIWLVIVLLRIIYGDPNDYGLFDLAFTTQSVTTFYMCCQSESTS